MTKKQKTIQFEEAFERLENIVKQLESGQENLEMSLELFEEGVAMTKLCREKLDTADQKIKELVGNSDSNFHLKELE